MFQFFFVSLIAGCICGGGFAAALLVPDYTERSPRESDGPSWMEIGAVRLLIGTSAVLKSSCLRARVPGQSKRWEIDSAEKPQQGQLVSITVPLTSFVTLYRYERRSLWWPDRSWARYTASFLHLTVRSLVLLILEYASATYSYLGWHGGTKTCWLIKAL